MERRELHLGGTRFVLAGICEGLAGEAAQVAELAHELSPAVIALALEEGSMAAAATWEPAEALEGEDSLYRELLSAWGEVNLPPASYGLALQLAEDQGARCIALDLGEGHYADLFTEAVGFWDLFKRTRRLKKLSKRGLQADSPEALCRAFDARVNQGPFAALEARRERAMAEGLAKLVGEGPVMAVLPVARLDGVVRELEAANK